MKPDSFHWGMALLVSTAAGAEAPVAPAKLDNSAAVAELDRLWSIRDEGDSASRLSLLLDADLKAAPDDYEFLWRAARWHCWQSDGLPAGKAKEREALLAWEIGDKAVGRNPQRAEAYFYAAGGVGLYAQAISIVMALLRGMEGKFLDRMNMAVQLDPDLQDGAPLTLMGRFFYELPWPKYDGEKSLQWFNRSLARHPTSARLHLYLAQTLLKEGRPKQAMEEIARCLAIAPGTSDAPEERRVHEWAKAFQPAIEAKLR